MPRTAWQIDGLCAQTDPESFYPDKGKPADAARRVCRRCPVQDDCLTWALETNEQFGVWGGLTANQRREMRRAGRRSS